MQSSQSRLLAAVTLASKKLSGTERIDETLKDVLAICVEAVGANSGTIYLHNRSKGVLEFRHILPADAPIKLTEIPDNFGKAGEAFQTKRTIISEFRPNDESRREIEEKVGTTSVNMISVPLMMDSDEPIGVVQLLDKNSGLFDEDDAAVLETLSAVSTMAFLNSKLLEESSRANQLLGMGRIGHDIKNMAFTLDAIFAFAGDNIRQIKDELGIDASTATAHALVDDLEETISELSRSIDQIKRYSMLMSDLSAGAALKPNLVNQPMHIAVSNSASYFGSACRNSCIWMVEEIEESDAAYPHDDMFVFRMVQNMISNAIKAIGEQPLDFSRDMDEDRTNWKKLFVRFFTRDGAPIIEVQDQGPGMPENVRNRILQGNAVSHWSNNSGSGWGTKIILELARAHDADVEIDSVLGEGTTFRIVFPPRQG